MPYAPVLERMVELLQRDERMKFGDALERAAVERGFGGVIVMPGAVLVRPEIPEHVRQAMLTGAFKLVTGGFSSDVNA